MGGGGVGVPPQASVTPTSNMADMHSVDKTRGLIISSYGCGGAGASPTPALHSRQVGIVDLCRLRTATVEAGHESLTR